MLGAVVAIATMLLLGALVPAGTPARGLDAIGLLLERGWPAAIWMLAAAGLGSVLVHLLPAWARDRGVGFPLGVAGLVVIDLALGGLGLLGRGHESVAWAVVAVPGTLAIVNGLRSRGTASASDSWRLAIPLGVPIGVLLLAATSTPGWLWATEFGGYDALSYHLELPREWWYAGGLVETPHNAYGFLPGGVSAAFLHLMTLIGDPAKAAVSCQILVALLTIAAADAAGRLAVAWSAGNDAPSHTDDGTSSRSRLAMLALLSTPWVVVTGSLAYDEAAVMLAMAAAVSMLHLASRTANEPTTSPRDDLRFGAALGCVLALAVLAKASSGVLVVMPVAIAAAVLLPSRRWPAIVAGTATAGAIACLPWLVRNAVWTGNPVFPFATGLLGSGDWTDEQIRRFALGHGGPGVVGGLTAMIREFLFDDLAGGLPPGEPWRPQWWWLPIAGLAAIAWRLRRTHATTGVDRRRTVAIVVLIAAALLAWAGLTHAKARFLLAVAPILAAAIGLAGLDLERRWPRARPVVVLLAWLMPIAPLVMFATERDGAPSGAIAADDVLDGRLEARMIAEADPRTARSLRAEATRAFVLRDLDPTARVLLVGVADPFHLAIEGPDGAASRFAYTTVWTKGPLERAFDATDESSPRAAATAAIEALAAAGFTHLLVAPTMLEIWTGSGWLDPGLEPARIAALGQVPGVRTVHRFRDGGVLFALDGPRSSDAPEPP